MATVTGVTAQRANEIEDRIITQVTKQGRNLVFTTEGGSELRITNAFPLPFESWPVGSYYYTDNPSNPSTYMMGGTWQRVAQGRVLVGVSDNPEDPDFNAPGLEGGSRKHALSINEMPTHSHGGKVKPETQNHSHAVTVNHGGTHGHTYLQTKAIGGIQAGGQSTVGDDSYVAASVSGGGEHSHTASAGNQTATHDHSIDPEGSGMPHNNLQPFLTVYIWQRTA